MSDSRFPRPLGADPRNLSNPRFDGVLGHHCQPGPVGQVGAMPTITPTGTGSIPTKKMEMNLLGSFPKPSSWTAVKERKLIQSKSWFPHSLDFNEVMGTGSIEIADPMDFLLKIFESNDPVKRLNFFSHGSTGFVGCSGSIADDGSNVSMTSGWTQVIGNKRMIADPYAKFWGATGQNSKTKHQIGTKTFSLDDVRKKVANAEIWFYVCNGGSDPKLQQCIANAFQTVVKAFSKQITFHAPANFPASRKHEVSVSSEKFKDFRKLDKDSIVRTHKPNP
jgi:hypothetical protein